MRRMGQGTPPAAGWYDDPERDGFRRYWNGTGWTDRRINVAEMKRRNELGKVANLIGLAFLVPFLLITFLPTKVGPNDCGTWLSRTDFSAYTFSTNVYERIEANNVIDACNSKLDDRRLYALVLLGFGAVVRFSFVSVVRAIQSGGS